MLGRFQLIVADPPWHYTFSRSKSRAVTQHYPVMSLDDICGLPTAECAADDAILLLWATAPKLPEGLKVMEAWGFEYKTFDVWRKIGRKGMGYYWRTRHEPILLGTRGHPGCPAPANRLDSVFDERPRQHSRKPDAFWQRVDVAFEYLPQRLEMFAREHRPGWCSWGYDVTGGRGLLEVVHDDASR